MDPFIFLVWIVGIIVALIIYGIVSSKLRARKLARLRREAMPVVAQSIRSGQPYNVFLNNGATFKNVKVAGLTEAPAGQFADFPLESWLVLEHADGKRVFVKPTSVRFFEEL